MKHLLMVLLAMRLLFSSAFAVESTPSTTQTVTLLVPSMTCAVCPITIKKALHHVSGVTHVSVDFKAKTASVTYHPQQVTAKALMQATDDVGYPSVVKKGKTL
tara:strand:- start:1989 stop:2297 length:309 start_codon:yes stop_codon:yes gene_type:complete